MTDTYILVKPAVSKHPSPEVVNLTECSITLKSTLSRIPDEIFDRKKFLETIKFVQVIIKNSAIIIVSVLYII